MGQSCSQTERVLVNALAFIRQYQPNRCVMNRRIQRILFSVLALYTLSGVAIADIEVQIAHYEWPQNSSVDDVLQIPQFRSALAHYDELENAQLIIRYPGGDEGNSWAVALRNSLVSLGIPQSDILLEPASGIPETIVLIVTALSDY